MVNQAFNLLTLGKTLFGLIKIPAFSQSAQLNTESLPSPLFLNELKIRDSTFLFVYLGQARLYWVLVSPAGLRHNMYEPNRD